MRTVSLLRTVIEDGKAWFHFVEPPAPTRTVQKWRLGRSGPLASYQGSVWRREFATCRARSHRRCTQGTQTKPRRGSVPQDCKSPEAVQPESPVSGCLHRSCRHSADGNEHRDYADPDTDDQCGQY